MLLSHWVGFLSCLIEAKAFICPVEEIVVAEKFVLTCVAESSLQVQARLGARVWSQFLLEVSESAELFHSQVTRNN